MTTRYPRIGTGKPGSIANKIYRRQRISPTSGTRQEKQQHRNNRRSYKQSRTSSDRTELIDQSDIETNSDILKNFNNLEKYNAKQISSRSDHDLRDKPSKPNHYVPFNPRDSPTQDGRTSRAWSDSSQYEASNYNSYSGPSLPSNRIIDHLDKTEENSSEGSNQNLAVWSCVIIVSIIILLAIIIGMIYYLAVGGEYRGARSK